MVIPQQLDFIPIQGKGLSERILQSDWTGSPLGQPTDWNPLFRSMVAAIAMNPQPTLLCWGMELVQLSNDPFCEVFGEFIPGQPLEAVLGADWKWIWAPIAEAQQGKTVTLQKQPLQLGDRQGVYRVVLAPVLDTNESLKGLLITLEEQIPEGKADITGEHLRQAIDAAELATFDFNPITQRFTANDRLKAWFGLPLDAEVDLEAGLEPIADKDKDRVMAAITAALDPKSGGVYDIFYTLNRRDLGEAIQVHARGKVWFDRDGNPFRFTGTIQDVSAQFKAEGARENLGSLIELSDEFIALADEHLQLTYLNPAALEMLGWKEFKGQSMEDFFQEDDRKEAARLLKELSGNSSVRTESRLWNAEKGQEFWLQWNGLRIKDSLAGSHSYAFIGVNTTERKRNEERVRLSESNLRLMILQAPMAIAIFRGPDYITEIANRSALELWGRKSREVLHKPILQAMPELEAQGIRDLLDHVRLTGERFSSKELPVEIRRNDQLETIYINFSYEALYNTDGEIDRIMTIGVDVTQQVLARKAVESNEEKLNLIIDASELGTWTLDIPSQQLDCSERCLDIFGFPKGASPGREELLSCYPEGERKRRDQAMELALRSGRLYYKARILRKDGKHKWVEVLGKMLKDAQGNPQKFLGTIRDITEETLSHKELEEREAKFRLLADSMPQFVWIADPNGLTKYFNQAMIAYIGLPEQTIQDDGWVHFIHPDDREDNFKHWKACIQEGKPYLYEHRFRRHDGEYRWFLTRALPQYNEEGEIIRWVGTSTDIQEHKAFTQELERQVQLRTVELKDKNNALKKMNQELKSFTYISSHDLQEPLRKIRMFSGMLVEREFDKLSDSGKNKFRRIEKSAERMQRLIEDLLLYSRTNTSNREREKKSLQSILTELDESFQEEIDQGQLELSCTDDAMLNVIPFQIHQLLLNLVGNSLKFAKPGEPAKVHIECREGSREDMDHDALEGAGKWCHLRISDQGIGFEPAYEQKIFEVFQRLHAREEFEGTGMGLAIVKKIVENHDGHIKATGAPGEGAVFDIYLPC